MSGDRISSDVGPYTIVPEWVARSGISGGAVHLYVVLGLHSNRSGESYPSRRRLAAAMSCSTDTVDRRTAELVDIRALTISPRFSEDHDRTSNLYRLKLAAPDTLGGGREDAATVADTGAATPGRANAAQNKSQLELEVEIPLLSAEPTVDHFGAFWSSYPHSVGRRTAAAAYARAIKRATPEEIAAGLAAHLPGWATREKRFIPHPTTWLNRDGWADDPPTPAGRNRSGPSRPPIMEDRDVAEGRVIW